MKTGTTEITVNLKKDGTGYKPHWKTLITAGRASEGLYADWREQLKKVQKEIGFEYIRFHGIFNDDMMVYHEYPNGDPLYNWQYIDSLFDFLLSINIRPILELSFTPHDMRSGEQTIFWWKGNVTPPKDYKKWADLVSALVNHCINRYGMEEIRKWYFEVWNEANITPFWSGTQDDYFRLYNVTVKAIKDINPDFKVGGPATSSSDTEECPWIREFLEYCEKEQLPVDFVSTHPYPNSYPLFDYGKPCYKDENGTYDSLKWLEKTIHATPYKGCEVHLTEWNSSPNCRDLVHDTAFMAPFIIQNNIRAIGLTDSIGFWDFTDIFEEGGLGATVFHGGFGLINVQGLEKPAYHGYWFLSRLGDKLLEKGDNYIVTRKDERVQVLMWNYCHYNDEFANGNPEKLTEYDRYRIFREQEDVHFKLNPEETDGQYKVIQYVFDREHGSVYDNWMRNGHPACPDAEEIEILKSGMKPVGSIFYPDSQECSSIDICIKPHGVTFLEFAPIRK